MMKYLAFPLACSLSCMAAEESPANNTSPLSLKDSGMSFEIYGEVVVMQPNGSDLYYTAQATPANPDYSGTAQIASPDWKIYEIDPSYQTGFKVGTKAIFNSSKMNIDTSWERVHAKDTASHTAPTYDNVAKQPMVGPITDIGPNSAVYNYSNGIFKSHFDAVNVNLGKTIDLSPRLKTNFYAGAGFVRIKQSAVNTYVENGASTSRIIDTYSDFIGAGPQFRADFDFRMFNNFYFDGSIIASMVVGQMKNATTYTSNTPNLEEAPIYFPSSQNVQKTSVPTRTQLVPGIEQTLGFSYLAQIKQCKVDIAIGYRCQVYFNAVQTMDILTQAVPEDFTDIAPSIAVFALTYNRTLSNYMLIGPYASVSIDF